MVFHEHDLTDVGNFPARKLAQEEIMHWDSARQMGEEICIEKLKFGL